jgi:hypothetical protein
MPRDYPGATTTNKDCEAASVGGLTFLEVLRRNRPLMLAAEAASRLGRRTPVPVDARPPHHQHGHRDRDSTTLGVGTGTVQRIKAEMSA